MDIGDGFSGHFRHDAVAVLPAWGGGWSWVRRDFRRDFFLPAFGRCRCCRCCRGGSHGRYDFTRSLILNIAGESIERKVTFLANALDLAGVFERDDMRR